MQAARQEKGFSHPEKAGRCDADPAGQCHTCFSKFVPLRQLFDNRYTVGTEIRTLYQTERQIAAATVKTRFTFVNAVDRDIIKVLKSVLGFPLDCSKCQAN